ncbi:hypothetical protein O6H91_17G039900 [Diphasiastrum complanatum]|uniref:Uncharacterized protein n=1 Tax=Diphasiastrum complanatum TaxID=34168 RepID=A0ACC2B5W6_DIPCM|nr:hypothetical protein O6H91_17G039900 [Diphasiastrum complanatum]
MCLDCRSKSRSKRIKLITRSRKLSSHNLRSPILSQPFLPFSSFLGQHLIPLLHSNSLKLVKPNQSIFEMKFQPTIAYFKKYRNCLFGNKLSLVGQRSLYILHNLC